MFENIGNFFKKMVKQENKELGSKDDAKERLHLVLMQDRANVSADFLELMKQEIIDVIKKYIVIDEASIDVRLTNKTNEDGVTGAPSLYANIPIINIKNDMRAEKINEIREFQKSREQNLDTNIKEITTEEFIDNEINIIHEEVNSNEDENKLDSNDLNKIEAEKNSELKDVNIENKKVVTKEDAVIEIDSVKENTSNRKGGKNNSSKKKKNEEHKEIIKEENKKNIDVDETDDEDDDVTFDELLKVAEEDIKKSEGINKK